MKHNQDTLALLRQSDNAAQKELECILSSPNMTPDALYPHLKRYTLSKFLLDDSCPEDDFFALAEISMGQALGMNPKQVNGSDLSLHCSGASSVATKKVLLLMALQKGLGISFDPKQVPSIRTVHDLSQIVYQLRKNN